MTLSYTEENTETELYAYISGSPVKNVRKADLDLVDWNHLLINGEWGDQALLDCS